jgi:hypothetical protein
MSGFPGTLIWGNFRKVRQSPKPPLSAYTSVQYQVSPWKVVLDKGKYRVGGFQIAVSFDSVASWAMSGAVNDPGLLAHEQGHYDITGLVARDLAIAMLDLSLDESIVAAMKDAGNTKAQHMQYVYKSYKKSIDEYYRKANSIMGALQTDPTTGRDGIYDRQTNHGSKQYPYKRYQDIWNARFSRMKSGVESFGLDLAIEGIITMHEVI